MLVGSALALFGRRRLEIAGDGLTAYSAWSIGRLDVRRRYARFVLPPIEASAGRRYYVWLDATASGVAVYTAGAARLGDGTA